MPLSDFFAPLRLCASKAFHGCLILREFFCVVRNTPQSWLASLSRTSKKRQNESGTGRANVTATVTLSKDKEQR
jgi:hypothetical protein